MPICVRGQTDDGQQGRHKLTWSFALGELTRPIRKLFCISTCLELKCA